MIRFNPLPSISQANHCRTASLPSPPIIHILVCLCKVNCVILSPSQGRLNGTNPVKSRGISTAGGFLPKTRLERSEVSQIHDWALPGLKGNAKGRKAVAPWDQDSITMAVEAFRNSGATTHNITQLTLASTSHPFKDRSSSAIALAALALPDTTLTTDTSCNRRAGT